MNRCKGPVLSLRAALRDRETQLGINAERGEVVQGYGTPATDLPQHYLGAVFPAEEKGALFLCVASSIYPLWF